jgi:predicted nucleotidyltransferase
MEPTPPDVLGSLARSADTLDPDVVSVYVFGSQAEGRAHRHSDVDVGVLVDHARRPTRAGRFDLRLQLVGRLSHALGRPDVDVVILNDTPPQFARHIVSRGRRLYCRDEAADHTFVRTALLRAADLEPFLRRTRRRKLQSLER